MVGVIYNNHDVNDLVENRWLNMYIVIFWSLCQFVWKNASLKKHLLCDIYVYFYETDEGVGVPGRGVEARDEVRQ